VPGSVLRVHAEVRICESVQRLEICESVQRFESPCLSRRSTHYAERRIAW
jgi:hypothetical protein